MNARWTIRLGAVLFAIGLIGSTAFAAKLDTRSTGIETAGTCGASCERTVTGVDADPYPAYQPLEVCDDVCIFY